MRSVAWHRVAVVALVLGPGAALAGAVAPLAAEPWQPTALFGGNVTALAQAPSAPRVLYAGTYVAGVFRSDDGGESWVPRNQSMTGDGLSIGIGGLAVAPSDPDLVFAISGDGLLRSRDGGKTWALLSSAPAINQLSFQLSGSLLGAAGDGLYRSGDEGDSWTLLAFEGASVDSVLEDPRGRHPLFATVSTNDGLVSRLWKSTDGGMSWQIKLGGPSLDSLTLDPSRSGWLYVLGDGFLYRSVDEGETWTLLPEAPGPVALAASANGILYAAAYPFDVWRSFDGGETWLTAGPKSGHGALLIDEIWDLVADMAHPDSVLAGGAMGVWRSTNNGITWSMSSEGILASEPASVAIGRDGSLFATPVGHLARSGNEGRTWQHAGPEVLPDGGLIVTDPIRPEILYLPDVLLRSRDGGRTWQSMAPPGTTASSFHEYTQVNGFAIDPRSPEILYLTGYTDSYGDDESFFFRSLDGGSTWHDLSAGIPNTLEAIAVAPSEPAVVYTIEDGVGLLRSDDSGQGFSLVGEGLPDNGNNVLASLAVDPRQSSVVYVGTNGSGVYRSADGGRHFAALGAGPGAANVATLIVDPTEPGRVYAGVASLGVFRWNQEANSWDPLNDALPLDVDPYTLFSGSIALAAGSQILYAATLRGIYRLPLTPP